MKNIVFPEDFQGIISDFLSIRDVLCSYRFSFRQSEEELLECIQMLI